LLVDWAVLLENVRSMAARAKVAGVALRPHAKTHKCVEIAKVQMEHGAIGLAVATLREAECFADNGFTDLLITGQVVGTHSLERLLRVARQARVSIAIDDVEVAGAIDGAALRAGLSVGLLWEIDCGVGRSGTQPGKPTVDLLAKVLPTLRAATFEGLMTYGGHVYQSSTDAELEAAANDEAEAVRHTARLLEDRGIGTRVLSVGTTPTACRISKDREVSEIRPGTYVFNDATQLALGLVERRSCALTVLSTVISHPTSNRIILDAGAKALSARRLSARTEGFGLVVDHPGLAVTQLYDEHGVVESDSPISLRVGDRVKILPNHAASTVNQHSCMWVIDSDDAVTGSLEVHARAWGEASGPRRSVQPVKPLGMTARA
jgi:D-serine deaminase-like pyridoxal phosphate-dependent protein